jgi:hypothetical protein
VAAPAAAVADAAAIAAPTAEAVAEPAAATGSADCTEPAVEPTAETVAVPAAATGSAAAMDDPTAETVAVPAAGTASADPAAALCPNNGEKRNERPLIGFAACCANSADPGVLTRSMSVSDQRGAVGVGVGGGEGNGPFPGQVSLKRNALDVAKSHGDPEDLENQAIELLLRHASWCVAAYDPSLAPSLQKLPESSPSIIRM